MPDGFWPGVFISLLVVIGIVALTRLVARSWFDEKRRHLRLMLGMQNEKEKQD